MILWRKAQQNFSNIAILHLTQYLIKYEHVYGSRARYA